MSYEPTIWKKGDKVTSTKLNKIENGIQGNDTEISNLKEDLTDEITELKSGLTQMDYDVKAEEVRAKSEEARIEALFTAPTQEAVDNWLNDHPEATTTVQDGAITWPKLNNSVQEEIDWKAPAIVGETAERFSFSASELAEYIGYELTCSAQGLSSVYALRAENIVPDFDPLTSNIVTNPGGLVFTIDGTRSSAGDLFPRVSGSLQFLPKKAVQVGTKIRVGYIANGEASNATPLRVNLYYRYADGTSKEHLYDIATSKFGTVCTAEYTVEKELNGLQFAVTVRAGEYSDCKLIMTAAIVDGDVWEQIPVPESGIVRLTPSDVGDNGITILPAKSVVTYVADTKTYVDEHIPDDMLVESDLVYLSPEMYGAKGDGITDDYEALQACMDAAVQNDVAVRCFGKYLTSQPVKLVGESKNVYLHNLIYTGNDVAFWLTGTYNCVRIDRIYAYNSTGAGFRLSTNADLNANYNKVDLGAVLAYTNGIEYSNDLGTAANRKTMYYNVLHVQMLYSKTANGILFHSTGGQGNENSFWGKHVSCYNGWLFYCDADSNSSLRLYEFCFENACLKGVYGAATLINCRTVECMDKKRPDNGDTGTILKCKKIPSGGWISTSIDYDCLDVSECDTFDERYAYMNEKYQSGTTQALSYDFAFDHGKDYTFGPCNRLWDFYARNSNGLCPIGKLIAYFNHKGFVPDKTWYHKISVADYTPLVTDKCVPTQFDIDAPQCTIHLEDSYCCVGINEFTLIQYADKKAIVYEKNDSATPIFDGTNLDAGVYKFTCTRLPKQIDILNADGSVAGSRIVEDLYFGMNEKWTVEKLNIVS